MISSVYEPLTTAVAISVVCWSAVEIATVRSEILRLRLSTKGQLVAGVVASQSMQQTLTSGRMFSARSIPSMGYLSPGEGFEFASERMSSLHGNWWYEQVGAAGGN